jgi:hypothetical protein
MNAADRQRRELFLATFQPLYYWPSDTMAVKCWRSAREALSDGELDRLISAMVGVHNSRAGRLRNGGPDARRDRLQQE